MLCGYIRELGSFAEIIPCEGVSGGLWYAASKNPNAKAIAFYSLYDVMPVDEPEWKVEPLGGDCGPGSVELPKEYGPCIVAGAPGTKKALPWAFCGLWETLLQVEGDIPVT